VVNSAGKKRKRRSGWKILKDMWDGLWIWGNIPEESRKGLDIDQFGRTEVDGTRRSLRIANKDQNLIKAREESASHNVLLIKERGEAE